MRIGQVNMDNYKEFLNILGIKNPKSLSKFDEKLEELKNMDWSFEAQAARAVAAGRAVEGMVIRADDESWKKIVDVPDSFRQQSIKSARDIITIISKTGGMCCHQWDKYVEENKDYSYIMSRPPEERFSISWTGEKIYQAEMQRMTDFLMTQIPGWRSGQPFDINVLINSNWGLDENYLDKKV